MAKKSGTRLIHRDSVTQNRKQDTFPDEITLRDEILELKRQLMILKRTNEQYSVKLRKYEDEAKRKDKQLEQLMDPRKNFDITKVLSTKGAAILMNLKDQNNALIQMILNKDLHIRRLMAQIKMSKLYASTKKNEGYRAEISRLRNLLIKSQETLKENVDFHEQSRSICVSGNSFLEFSSSSNQSSPRDLDDLRLIILNLESHIQQSNDMLAKKNQEILLLKDEINFLKKFSRHKTLKNKFQNCESTQCKNYEYSTVTQPEGFIPNKILNEDIINFFEKSTIQDDEKQLSPTQDISKKWITSIDSVPKYNIHSYVSEETTELIETNQENIERVNRACSLMGKSLFHHLASDEIKREEKVLSNLKSTSHVKEKWKKALNKYRELKQLNSQMFSSCIQVEKVYLKYDNKESEIKRNPQDTFAEDEPDDSNNPVVFLEEAIESKPKTPESNHNGDNTSVYMCQSSGKESSILRNENVNLYETHNKDVQQIESKSPTNSQNNDENSGIKEEAVSKNSKPFQENYFPSLDSDFDSDYDYSVKQEVQQVQVEVQINSVSSESENDQAGNNISETNQFYEYDRESNGNLAPEHDFNDDDDVIIREK